MPVRIELARRAEQDLLDIERWLLAEAGSKTARRMLIAIQDKIDRLEEHPNLRRSAIISAREGACLSAAPT